MSMSGLSSGMSNDPIGSLLQIHIKYLDRYVGIIVVVIIRAATACGEMTFSILNQGVRATKSARKTTVSDGQKPW